MMIVETELKESSINGLGVFAQKFIPKGSVVWQLDDRFYLLVEESKLDSCPELMKTNLDIYAYPHMSKPGIICCEIDNGRFMNHSDDPNTVFTDPNIAFATRDIEEGEEITCNYGHFMPGFKGFD